MTTILYIPVEPLTERYTEQWFRIFPKEFSAAGFETVIVHGETLIDNEIKVGSFLDINSTLHYKMSQLQTISKMFHRQQIKPGTIFFFGDIEFWGLESVRLMADMNGIPVKMAGFLHAASYTREDAFAIAAPYQQFTEVGWIAALDKVFVGSDYHKEQVLNERVYPISGGIRGNQLRDRIVVTRNPIFVDEYKHTGKPKVNKMVLTNRLDQEKRPWETLQLFQWLHREFPHWEFVVTTGRKNIRTPSNGGIVDYIDDLQSRGVIKVKSGLTKAEYHEELETAKIMVSHSIEENYGYCIAEALVYGCAPLLRQGLSHTELVYGNKTFLFEDKADAHIKARNLMQKLEGGPILLPHLQADGMQNIINELLEWKTN